MHVARIIARPVVAQVAKLAARARGSARDRARTAALAPGRARVAHGAIGARPHDEHAGRVANAIPPREPDRLREAILVRKHGTDEHDAAGIDHAGCRRNAA